MQQHNQAKVSLRPLTALDGGLPVRTNLRGGTCVDVDDKVKTALQTLTTALGGTTTATAPAATTTSTTPTTSS